MNCPNCGTALAPGSGFCGACGTRIEQAQTPPAGTPQYAQPGYPQQGMPPQGMPPQGYPPPGQQNYPPPGQPYPQQGMPPQGYPPPGQPYPQQGMPPQGYPPSGQPGMPPQGYPPPQQNYPPQGAPEGFAHGAPPQAYGAPTLRPFPIVMQRGLTRLTGQFFLAPTRVFFLCESQKGGLGIALGQGLGGLVGGAIAALAAPTPGQAPLIDEPTLFQAVNQMPGSMVMEPQGFKSIKYTMWTRGIFYGGNTYALRDGLSNELRRELGLWCQANNVMAKGLLK